MAGTEGKSWDFSYLKDYQVSRRFQGVTGTCSTNIAEGLISNIICLMTVVYAMCHNVSNIYVLPGCSLAHMAILVGNTTDYSFISAVIAAEWYQDVVDSKK